VADLNLTYLTYSEIFNDSVTTSEFIGVRDKSRDYELRV